MKAKIKNIDTGKYFKKTCCGGKIIWTKDIKDAFVFTDAVGLSTRIKFFNEKKIGVKVIYG